MFLAFLATFHFKWSIISSQNLSGMNPLSVKTCNKRNIKDTFTNIDEKDLCNVPNTLFAEQTLGSWMRMTELCNCSLTQTNTIFYKLRGN